MSILKINDYLLLESGSLTNFEFDTPHHRSNKYPALAPPASLAITGHRRHVDLAQLQRQQLLDTVTQFCKEEPERHSETEKVIFLQDGIELDHPVKNDKTTSDYDQTVAFVQEHRYVSFSKLWDNPEYTTELEVSD